MFEAPEIVPEASRLPEPDFVRSSRARVVRGEQRPQRLLVPLHLECMIGPDRPGARDGRTRIYRREPALDIRISAERFSRAVHHAHRAIDPAPERHVGDRVTVADDESSASKMVFDHLVMPLRLAPVAVDGVVGAGGREQLEVHRLARERAEAGRDEEEPGHELWPIFGRTTELAGLVAKVEKDRAGIEHTRLFTARAVGVDDRWHFAV